MINNSKEMLQTGAGMLKATITYNVKDKEKSLELIKKIAELEYEISQAINVKIFFSHPEDSPTMEKYVEENLTQQKAYIQQNLSKFN